MSEMGSELQKKSSETPAPRSAITPAQRVKALSTAFLIMISTAAGFGGGWFGASAHRDQANSNGTGMSQQIAQNEGELISSIAKDVGPSVVSINVTIEGERTDIFGMSRSVEQESAGTGIIISKDGYIVTNRHVIPVGATAVSVTLSDGTELADVEVIGRTNDSDPLDVAFLKVKDTKGKELKAAILGDSADIQVGDRVVAIGNALGQFQNTVTSGIISGFGRSVEARDDSGGGGESLQNLLQTDAAINQGNSGGPLVNVRGEVVGINTAVAGGAAQNIGFAIPLNDIKGLVTSVLNKGKLERPYLGVRYVALTDDYAYEYNLSVKRGAYIAPGETGGSVIQGSPADKAGLKEKDVITKINGVAIDETHSLISLISQYAVGEEVKLTVVRDGKEQTITIKLEAAPSQ